MKYINGNLITLAKNGDFDVIVHGCNAFCTMGAGIAATIKTEFPSAYEADQKTKKGDKDKIGTYTYSVEKNNKGGELFVINAYTQFTYWEKRDLFEYDGFAKILKDLKVQFIGKHFGFPLIGCGLAGGDKERILGMIDDILHDQDVTIVEFIPPTKNSGPGKR